MVKQKLIKIIPYVFIAFILIWLILSLSYLKWPSLKDWQICSDQRCLLERNAKLQVENSLQLAKAKSEMITYEKLYQDAKAQYEKKQHMREQITIQENMIINSWLELSQESVFTIDRRMSENFQQMMSGAK